MLTSAYAFTHPTSAIWDDVMLVPKIQAMKEWMHGTDAPTEPNAFVLDKSHDIAKRVRMLVESVTKSEIEAARNDFRWLWTSMMLYHTFIV